MKLTTTKMTMIINGATVSDLQSVVQELPTLSDISNMTGQQPFSRKARNLFESIMPFFFKLKTEVYTPETSCMKGISVHIKNMGIKPLCNHKLRDSPIPAFRVGKLFGTFGKTGHSTQ